jgi:hypothetical protein
MGPQSTSALAHRREVEEALNLTIRIIIAQWRLKTASRAFELCQHLGSTTFDQEI